MNKPTVKPKKKYAKPDLYTTVRLWPKTVRKLKQISAIQGKTMVATLDEMATMELSKNLVADAEAIRRTKTEAKSD